MIDFGSSDSDFVEDAPSRPSIGGKSGKASSSTVATAEIVELPPGYLVELARSGRAECKRCSSIIANKELRVGVIVEGDWGIMTRWQHLKCTVFHKSITKATELDGYTELDPEDKAIVRKRVKDSLNEIDEDDIPVDPNELIRTGWTEAVDAPPDLVLPLLPYQREGLGWMVNQENNGVHGGILADEMVRPHVLYMVS